MSFEAIAWAFDQKIKSSTLKFTLVGLCNCENRHNGRIHPSIRHICEITGQNRKTVINNLKLLQKLKLIEDTGQRVGGTKQIIVYSRLHETGPESEQFLKRNGSAFTQKQSQIRDTEPGKKPISSEPKGSSDSNQRKKIDEFPIPDGVDPVDWEGLKENRKLKRASLSKAAYRQIIQKLNKWEQEGWPPGPIVANAAEKGWATVFETDEMKNGTTHDQQQRKTSDGGRPSGWLS